MGTTFLLSKTNLYVSRNSACSQLGEVSQDHQPIWRSAKFLFFSPLSLAPSSKCLELLLSFVRTLGELEAH